MPNGLGGIGLMYLGREWARGARRAAIRKSDIEEREKAQKIKQAERQRDRDFQMIQAARQRQAMSEAEQQRRIFQVYREQLGADRAAALEQQRGVREEEMLGRRQEHELFMRGIPPAQAPPTPLEEEERRAQIGERQARAGLAERRERRGVGAQITPETLIDFGSERKAATSAAAGLNRLMQSGYDLEEALSILKAFRPKEKDWIERMMEGEGMMPGAVGATQQGGFVLPEDLPPR